MLIGAEFGAVRVSERGTQMRLATVAGANCRMVTASAVFGASPTANPAGFLQRSGAWEIAYVRVLSRPPRRGRG